MTARAVLAGLAVIGNLGRRLDIKSPPLVHINPALRDDWFILLRADWSISYTNSDPIAVSQEEEDKPNTA